MKTGEHRTTNDAIPKQRSGHVRSVALVIQGDLGTQLFQWAFGEALRARGTSVAADTSRCRDDLPLHVGPLVDGWPHVSGAVARASAAAYRSDLASRWKSYLSESGPAYEPDLLDRAQTARYVVGSFRSPRYFEDQAEMIRHRALDFVNGCLTQDGRAVLRYLTLQEGFATVDFARAHVPVTVPSGGTTDYYERAWSTLQEQGFKWRVWFGDDLSRVHENLAGPEDLFMSSGLITSAPGQLALMAACRGRIIGEGTLGWWAGWLGRQPSEGGAVVGPRDAYAPTQTDSGERVPADWSLV